MKKSVFFATRLGAFLLVLLSMSFVAKAQTIDEIEQYDLRVYSPVNYGLKDLVFEVRISTLMDLLKERVNLSEVVDVYFKIHWIFPGQYHIEVEGLPRGFDELKAELRELVKERLEFVIPLPLSDKMRSYRLGYKTKSPIVVEGIDESHTRPVNRIEIHFENNGRMSRFMTFSPHGTTEAQIASSIKSWSHNKWVIDSYDVTTVQGQFKNTTQNRLTYQAHVGIGLPDKIVVKTINELVVPKDFKGEVEKQEMSSEVIFSKYEVNTGKAQRFMMQGLQR